MTTVNAHRRLAALALLLAVAASARSGGDVQDATLSEAESRTAQLALDAAAVVPAGAPHRAAPAGPLPCSDISSTDVEDIPEYEVEVGPDATLDDARRWFDDQGWDVEERPARTLVDRVDGDYAVTAGRHHRRAFLTATGPCRPVGGGG